MDISLNESDEIRIKIYYSGYFNATGALFNFLHLNGSEVIDFTRSSHLALERTISDTTLPYNLKSGLYRIHVYDIESGGILQSGLGYPATKKEFISSHNNQGNQLYL